MQFFANRFFFLLISSLFFGVSIFANSGEISLNDETVRLAVDFDLSSGFMVEAAAIHSEDRGNVFSVAGLSFGDAGSEGLNAGVGLKLAYVDPDLTRENECPVDQICTAQFLSIDYDGGVSLPIGGKVTYVPEAYNRINARAYLWFAPDVLSFDNMTKYQEIGGDIGFNVTRSADVFIGYRNVKGKFKGDENFGSATATIDTGLHFGIRGTF